MGQEHPLINALSIKLTHLSEEAVYQTHKRKEKKNSSPFSAMLCNFFGAKALFQFIGNPEHKISVTNTMTNNFLAAQQHTQQQPIPKTKK